jgi:D-alanyl-D-alanine dipeptidase
MKFLWLGFLFIASVARAQSFQPPSPSASPVLDPIPLVDLRRVDPTIVIELRYAGSNNIAQRPLYPRTFAPLVRPELAERLVAAQGLLRHFDFRLKIWDAYRPREVQAELWRASHNNNYVADPDSGAGSLHGWGIAVDATLVDRLGHAVEMPTDYDDFTPAASWNYLGPRLVVRQHLRLLQMVMRDAGFYGLRSEWWHFTLSDWKRFLPPDQAKRAEEAFAKTAEKKS